MSPLPIYFPPGVIDADGRRIRPGVIVAVEQRDGKHEVVGWQADGLILLDTETGDLSAAPKEVCRVIDDETTPRSSVGSYVIEFSDRRTTLVVGVGTRDLTVDGGLLDQASIRAASRELTEQLANLTIEEAISWCRDHLAAPILDRVLMEASLPVEIDELVLVVTDQMTPHPRDTRFMGELIHWHLRARGHIGDDQPLADDIRPIARVTPLVVSSLPHVVEAVHFAVSPAVPSWFAGDGRVAIVNAGGTPAMGFGILLAAASYARHANLPTNSVRTIQVPDVRGDGTSQPVIEFDVDDLAWWEGTR